MLLQLSIGSALLVFSIVLAGFGFWLIEFILHRVRKRFRRSHQGKRMLVFLSLASIWVFIQLTVGVWIWALCFWYLGIFETLEPAIYFSLVAFTTLGFGDILLPVEWRLLGGMTAVNGLLSIGFVTAILVEFLRQARLTPEDD